MKSAAVEAADAGVNYFLRNVFIKKYLKKIVKKVIFIVLLWVEALGKSRIFSLNPRLFFLAYLYVLYNLYFIILFYI